MGAVVTQKVTFEKWPADKEVFDDQADMFECLNDLVDAGHRGQVRAYPVGDEIRWDLEVSANDTAVAAVFGQCVVSMGGIIEALTLEQYTARYGSSVK
jgi:hypothetical protein